MTFRTERFEWGDDAVLVWHDEGMRDYDPDQPRDPQGRWTFAGGPKGEKWQAVVDDAIQRWRAEHPNVKAKTVELRRDFDESIAEAEKYQDMKDWYDKHRPLAKKLFGEDEPIFAKFLAAGSIQAAGAFNVQRAIEAYAHYKLGGSFEEDKYGDLPVVREQFARIARGEELSGEKIVPFSKALAGDLDQSVMDRWMKRLFFKTPQTKGGTPQVDAGRAVLEAIAGKMGWKPAQMQAALWAVAKSEVEGGLAGEVFTYKEYLEKQEARIRSIMHTVRAFSKDAMDAADADQLGKLADAYRDARLLVMVAEQVRQQGIFDREWVEEDHPREPKGSPEGGQFTSGATAFVSPVVAPGGDLKRAEVGMRGARQRELMRAGAYIDAKLGLVADSRSVIGAWADGAENSTMVSMEGVPFEKARVASAMKGWLADQKSVLVFEPDQNGDSYMASFGAQGKLDEIHDNLLKDGLEFHTLEPVQGGAKVHVFGSDQKTLDSVGKAAKRYDQEFEIVAGRGEFVGTTKTDGTDREQRDDARRVYEAVIREAATAKQFEGRDIEKVWEDVRRNWPSLEASKVGGGSAEVTAPGRSERFPVYINPSERDLVGLAKEAGHVRYMLTRHHDLYVWEANKAIHAYVEGQLDLAGKTWGTFTEHKGKLLEADYGEEQAEPRAQEVLRKARLGRALHRDAIWLDAEWNEEDHPRDPQGRFTFAGGGSEGTKHFEPEASARGVAKGWEDLDSKKQEKVEARFKEASFDAEVAFQKGEWRNSGEPRDKAAELVRHWWNTLSRDDTTWGEDALAEALSDWGEDHEKEIPYTGGQLRSAIELTGHDASGHLEVKFDDAELQEPADLAYGKGQLDLPGIDRPDPSGHLTPEMREYLKEKLTKAFNSRVDEVEPEIEPPDFTDVAREAAEEAWDRMDDDERFEWGKRNTGIIESGQEEERRPSRLLPPSNPPPSPEFTSHVKEVVTRAADARIMRDIKFDTTTSSMMTEDGPTTVYGATDGVTGKITIYVRNIQKMTDQQIEGIVKHEVMHRKYSDVQNAARAEFSAFTQSIGGDRGAALERMDKEMVDPAKYPVTAAMNPHMTDRGHRDLINEASDHPVSRYADQHWQAAAKAPRDRRARELDTATHEQLAEIARREYEDGEVPKNIPTWTALYNTINRLWGGVHAKRHPS